MSAPRGGTETIMAVLDYIETHIEQPITLIELARFAGYSPHHFARMFSLIVGSPVMEHVRRRKLWHASAALKQRSNVIDVALRFGFQSHEGFTRAFTRQFKIPPARYCTFGSGVIPPVPYPTQKEGGTVMEHRFVTREDTPVIGYLLNTAPYSPQIPEFWEKVMTNGDFDRLMKKSAKMENFGICILNKTDTDKMDYVVGFDYDGNSEIDPDMMTMTLPGGQFAVFRAQDHTAIREVWTHIYTQWMPASGYEFDGERYDFELYPDGKCCDIYIPIRKPD